MRDCGLLLVFLTLLVPAWAHALAPHELVVIANAANATSVEMANAYARRRGVPAANVVEVRVAAGADGVVPVAIDPAVFRRDVWDPLQAALHARGIDGHVQACVYSVGFPLRITTQPPVSITGLTFLRNQILPEIQVTRGLYASPLFAGPIGPGKRADPSVSLTTALEWLAPAPGEAPFPAMMLGYLGERGNTRAEVDACLVRSAAADASRPAGTVYFVTSEDIRSTTRAWQFPAVVKALREKRVSAVISNGYPQGAQIVGLMTGARSVRPSDYGRYVPGSVCDHFTSFAATFDIAAQDKLSRWIAAGASSSSGTVAEPYSLWTKIPHARFYEHYVAGCSLLEAYYLSVRCPLQLLPVGDPLLTPWHRGDTLHLRGVPATPVADRLTVSVEVESRTPLAYRAFEVYIDGRRTAATRRSGRLEVDVSACLPGPHQMYVVVPRSGLVHHPIFATAEFVVMRAP